MYPNLFSPLRVGGIVLKYRLTMAPIYRGYARVGGRRLESSDGAQRMPRASGRRALK